MLRATDSVTLQFTHAAVAIGLIVSSILSPIQVRTVDKNKMYVYGVALVYDSPPVAPLASPENVARGSDIILNVDGIQALSVKRASVKASLSAVSSLALRRLMTAYLALEVVYLLTCVFLVLVSFVQMLPIKHVYGIVTATRILTVVLPIAAILCLSIAATLGLKSSLYDDVAAGYYGEASGNMPESKLHTGFSSTIVAAIIEIFLACLSFLFTGG